MAKRKKKPAVRPELARQWLRRYEEDGESPPQIAQADGYDVRTVRKQLEIIRQEREIRQARQLVLRQALEKHYVDICAFAEKLRAEITSLTPSVLSHSVKDDPMWRALRQHLPRSPLWKDIEKMERLAEAFGHPLDRIKDRVRRESISRTSLEFISSADETGLADGLPESVAFHVQALARGERGLEDIGYISTPIKNGVAIKHGAFGIALVPEDRAEEVEAVSRRLLKEAIEWPDYDELHRLTQDFLRVRQSLKDELTTLVLRRVVPGKCDYCPF